MRVWAAALAIAGVASGMTACKTDGSSDGETGPVAESGETSARALPTSEDAFLARLLPLPDDAEAIHVRYRVEGTFAEGTFEVTLRPGGYRHDRWVIEWAGADEDEPFVSRGASITTPEWTWTGLEGQPGELQPRQLRAIAAAWMDLDDARKQAAAESVDRWHAILAEQRGSHPGERATVQGVSCLQTRIAAQNLCLWEEAGVFLRYDGAMFDIEAESIDRAPEIAEDTFTLPPAASGATKLPSEAAIDPDALLAALEAGTYEAMAALLVPELGLDAVAGSRPAGGVDPAEPADSPEPTGPTEPGEVPHLDAPPGPDEPPADSGTDPAESPADSG